MAEVQLDSSFDAEMGTDDPIDVDGDGAGAIENGAEEIDGDALEEVDVEQRVSFFDYLQSPIVELLIGAGEHQTLLTAHQQLLMRSPYFADICLRFGETSTRRRIDLIDYDIDPVGCLLEFLYTGEYFPRKVDEGRLEDDPSVPAVDDSGEQLLKHARVYTLADKLGLDELKTLAHSKIHRINSNAKGEIAYARFVYANTPREDTTIRKPVAAFWAHRSHVLRHEAEEEFRKMCLEFPQFGFDVLSLVLDAKEKAREKEHPGERSSRKRPRHSQV
ncbi:hypothetical protein FGG08_006167 [Glutinoglossum americanum]|uniref:BTB domain-containing protein n=1 Tax=Glutinoglossum americanum TaxID=1670608 RepID=A0A9P8HYV7_9PEZI|nr:hypothetical protein FGG08_006167 [Glutinoglossum americanum]